MKKLKVLSTICLLTGSIAIVSMNAMARSNDPKSGSGTISQGSTGPGANPVPRPTNIGASLR